MIISFIKQKCVQILLNRYTKTPRTPDFPQKRSAPSHGTDGGAGGGPGNLKIVPAGAGIHIENLPRKEEVAAELALHGFGVHLPGVHAARRDHRVGQIAPGLRADFLVCTPDLQLRQVWLGGQLLI